MRRVKKNKLTEKAGDYKDKGRVLSVIMDDGEVLVQEKPVYERLSREQSSITDAVYEEYVVQSFTAGEVTEEYVVEAYDTSETFEKGAVIKPGELKTDKIYESMPLTGRPGQRKPEYEEQKETVKQEVKTEAADNKEGDYESFVQDLEKILKGEGVYDSGKKSVVEKREPERKMEYSAQQTSEPVKQPVNEHAIFDKLRESMEFAKAYDLGSIELENRFSDFDKLYDIRSKQKEKDKKELTEDYINKGMKVGEEEFLRDLNEIAGSVLQEEEDNYLAYAKSVTGIVPTAVITDPFYRNMDEKKKLTKKSKGRSKHLGIDVSLSNASGGGIEDVRRGLPVYAAVKKSIPVSELNSVRTAEGTGMGLKGGGDAVLLNAVVLTQPWSAAGDAYGGVLGIACRYGYKDEKDADKKITLYIEFLHLITSKFPPHNGKGELIPAEEWKKVKKDNIDFGPVMKNDAVLQPSDFDNPPVVGYLGATDFPHVHVQAAFREGEHKYLKEVRFDPEIMLA